MKSVILLRHADIDIPTGPEPDSLPLNAMGLARAAELVHVLGNAGVTAIFASSALRTQQTIGPLAAKLGFQVRVLPTLPMLVQAVLSSQTGGVLVIAGHSNTVPQIITAIGAPFSEPAIQGHDDLFLVTVIATGQARLIHLKYGDRTP